MGSVLFICTGNYYRSRLADILFNYYAKEAGLDWHADSRGFTIQRELKGLARYPRKYLTERNMELTEEMLRNPRALSIEDFTTHDLTVLMNRGEHLPIMEERFSWMVKILQKENKLRLWNVHDLQMKANPVMKMMGVARDRIGQPEESAVEHIDFAVRALIYELQTGIKIESPVAPAT